MGWESKCLDDTCKTNKLKMTIGNPYYNAVAPTLDHVDDTRQFKDTHCSSENMQDMKSKEINISIGLWNGSFFFSLYLPKKTVFVSDDVSLKFDIGTLILSSSNTTSFQNKYITLWVNIIIKLCCYLKYTAISLF